MKLLVTGGTGTFGSTFVPMALKSGVFSKVAIYSRDEDKQFRQSRELGHDPRLRWWIGDTRDYDRLKFAMRGIDVVVHAAALKHVPSGEANPFEHIKTNIMGSQNVVMAAVQSDVKVVLGVSTDKAVDPINLYGATKLCMEKLFMASNGLGETRFSCVRYGNVLGSRGSFIETLQKLRDEGATTFPLRSMESTRFWISAEDACLFVLRSIGDMRGGEVFVPKLPAGTALSFAREYLPHAEPEIVGLPTGEKVHEALISEAESHYTTEESDRFVVRPNGPRRDGPAWSYTSDAEASK